MTLTDRYRIRLHSIRPVHPRGEPSYIAAMLELTYLKNEPVVEVRVTPEQAVLFIEQLAMAVRVTRRPA